MWLDKEKAMEKRLDELAGRLKACQRRGNKLVLENVLESAKILAEAKALAKRDFGKWLQERAHMTPETARRHLRVLEFVNRNPSLTSEIATLSLAKTYALTRLDLDRAKQLLNGKESLSLPLQQISDLQFRKEFKERFPSASKRQTRENAFRQTYSALVHAERALHQATRLVPRMTPLQRKRIADRVRALNDLVAAWKTVA